MTDIDLDALEARIEGSYDLCHINAREVTDVIARLREAEAVVEQVAAVPNVFEWDVPPTASAILAAYKPTTENAVTDREDGSRDDG